MTILSLVEIEDVRYECVGRSLSRNTWAYTERSGK